MVSGLGGARLAATVPQERARLEGEGFAPVRERWRALSDTLGRRVTVDAVTGVAQDLDHDGALLIDVGGTVQRVIAGEIIA